LIYHQKILKNNESIKYADPKIFKFSYFYNNLEDQIHYLSNNDQDKINICVIDGKILNIENCNKDIDIKINNIESINTFIHDKFLDFEKYFDQDYIFNLNSLFLNSGFEMTIGEGQEANIYISNAINKENTTLFQKNFIKCKKKSKINFIEEFSVDKPSNCNLVNFIDLEEGAELKHLNFQRNNVMANLQSTSLTHCQKDSFYKQVIANISYSSIRNHHYANINGEGVSVDLDGIFLGSKNQIIDNKTQVTHNFPNSNSRQRYKGVLTDNAKSSYLSKTVVDRIAQKTEAYQVSKGILLSDSSFFHSKPRT
jgi:ABC-type transport system involved in Fe-S cluster assembly, permease component